MLVRLQIFGAALVSISREQVLYSEHQLGGRQVQLPGGSLKSSVWSALELLDTDHPYFTFKQGLPDTHELLEFQRI
jgi:hypothetical protein